MSLVKHIKKTGFLEGEEEFDLVSKWQENHDPKALDRILRAHTYLISKIAKGYEGYGLSRHDLVAEGYIGMIHALKHFDTEKGFRLSTYARFYIKTFIQEYVMLMSSVISFGSNADNKKLFFQFKRVKEELEIYDYVLTPEQISVIASKMNVSKKSVEDISKRLYAKDYSLHTTVSGEDGEAEWIDFVQDENDNQEQHIIHMRDLEKKSKFLEEALGSLNAREKEIFEKRRLMSPPVQYIDLAKELSLSAERIRQIDQSIFKRVQKHIRNALKDSKITATLSRGTETEKRI